jgi:DNA-binding beta-propeller fold protein YncE
VASRRARRALALATTLTCLASGCARDAAPGPRLYVTSGFTDEVLVLDPADGRILDRIALDRRPADRDEPHGVAVAPDGRHWYATVAHGEPSLWKFEAPGDRLVGRLNLPTAGASRVDVSPDGARAVVPDYWLGGLGQPSRVAVVSLHDMTLVDAPVVCPAPHHAAFDPAGHRIAVVCTLSDEIVVLEADGLDLLARFPVAPGEASLPGNPLHRPMNLAWSPNGTRIYATLMRSGLVTAYTPDGDVLWSVRVGAAPAQIALTPDGRQAFTANRGDARLGIVDTETGEARSLPLDGALHPHGVALDPAGTTAYVAYEGTTTSAGGVVAVDLVEGRVLWRTPAGVFTLGVAYRR